MKKMIQKISLALLVITAMSFNNVSEKRQVKIEGSKIVWKGYKVTGSHEGTINLKSGVLDFNGSQLVGGQFIIDMTTISSTDLTGGYKGKLDGHLKSPDFFGVEANPTSTLVFKKVKLKEGNTYSVIADLTIKEKTAPVSFDISVYENKASAALKINRVTYGIKYGSTSFFDNLKNKAIDDEFDLIVDLVF